MNFLQRLFSQPKLEAESSQPPSVVPNNDEQVSPQVKSTLSQLSAGLHVGKLSDVGRVRERNEDSLYVAESLLQHSSGQEPFGVFIVADGMGGHERGDVASATAARVAANTLLEDVYLPTLSFNHHAAKNRPINETLVAAVENANEQVQKSAPDGGTTLTLALVMGNSAYIAHVGDTRAYFFNQNKLKQITEDHSLAQRLKETGQATPEQIAQIENVLYRAIGQGGAIEVDTHIQHLPPGSSLLLCSDGLWKGIDNDDLIRETLSTAATPQEACNKLVAMANENGGEDNITIVVVSMGIDS